MTALWDKAPCTVVEVHRRFKVRTATIIMTMIITLMIEAVRRPTRRYINFCGYYFFLPIK
jgi:hypothetical protein